MNEQKLNNVIIAVTASAVLLLVILLSVMIYQMVSVSVKRREEAKLNEQIAVLREMVEQGKSDIEICSQKWWIEQRAFELEYHYPDSKVLGESN